MKPVKSWLADVKLRASWGMLGNQNIGTYPYQALLSLTGAYPFNNTSLSPGAAQTALNNNQISWEKTTTSDIGIDLALFDNWSVTFDLYKKTYDPTNTTYAKSYKTSSIGGGMRWGVPIAEKETISFGVAVDKTEIDTFDDSRQIYKDFVKDFGNSNTSASVNLGWSRDGRDSLIYPTKGALTRVSTEVAPAGTLKFYKMNLQHQRFIPFTKDLVLMLNGEIGIGNGLGGGKSLPFYRSYYAGGVTSVRGYDVASLGPRQNDEAIGGTKRVVMNAELLFPMPGTGLDKSLRLGWFVDAGQVFGPKDDNGDYSKFALGDLRYSTGLAVAWSSPMGPLKFSVAQPLNDKEGDKTQRFQFTMGTTF